eukprot:1320901-Rhodomonas_salina.1
MGFSEEPDWDRFTAEVAKLLPRKEYSAEDPDEPAREAESAAYFIRCLASLDPDLPCEDARPPLARFCWPWTDARRPRLPRRSKS